MSVRIQSETATSGPKSSRVVGEHHEVSILLELGGVFENSGSPKLGQLGKHRGLATEQSILEMSVYSQEIQC